jgi:hypothetical protein
VLKKSFWGDDQNFSGLLMRFARDDMRGPHHFTQKRPRSYVWALGRIAVVEPLKISFARFSASFKFSTFSTLSALFGPDRPGWRRLFLRVKRTSQLRAPKSENDPELTSRAKEVDPN